MRLWWLFFLAQLSIASLGLHRDDVIASLTNEKVLYYARACAAIYKLRDGASNEALTAALQAAGMIHLGDQVIIQGTRHYTGQRSALLVKRARHRNHFLAVFVGTKTSQDVLSDIIALPSFEDIALKLEEAVLAAMPTKMRIWAESKLQTETREDQEHDIGMHLGFVEAGLDFSTKLLAGLTQHCDQGQPIHLDITGHSMGGAIAATTAFELKQRLPGILNIGQDQLSFQIILFAAAGAFREADLPIASQVMSADNCMVTFYRPHDFARELTALVGYRNPGHSVELDDFVRTRRSLLEFVRDTLELQESPATIRAKLAQVGANHSIDHYVETIEKGITDVLDEAVALEHHQMVPIHPAPTDMPLVVVRTTWTLIPWSGCQIF